MDEGYTVYETHELHVPIYNCHCKHQRCKGKYIKSREGQEECLFSLAEKGLIEYLPTIWLKDDLQALKWDDISNQMMNGDSPQDYIGSIPILRISKYSALLSLAIFKVVSG